MAVIGRTTMLDPQSDVVWILSSTFIVLTMQSGKIIIKTIVIIILIDIFNSLLSLSVSLVHASNLPINKLF